MDDLIRTLKLHEGTNPFVYIDTNGFSTIATGRCVDKRCEHGLSQDEIDYLLANDIKNFTAQLSGKPYYIGHDKVRQEVLVELVFNMGIEGVEKFKNFLNAFAFKHYSVAVGELKNSLWAEQVHAGRVNNICYRIINVKYP